MEGWCQYETSHLEVCLESLEACVIDVCSASVSCSEPLPTYQLLSRHRGHCAVPFPQGHHQGEGIDNYTPSDSMKEGDRQAHMPKIASLNLASFYIFLQLPQMSRRLSGGMLGTLSPFSSELPTGADGFGPSSMNLPPCRETG